MELQLGVRGLRGGVWCYKTTVMCRLDAGFRSVRDPWARMTSRSSMLRLPETSKVMPNTVVTQSHPKMRTLL